MSNYHHTFIHNIGMSLTSTMSELSVLQKCCAWRTH